MAKAIGLILTITSLMLGWRFYQTIAQAGPAPPPAFALAAIAVMMLSVGVRDVITSPAKKKNNREEGSPT